MYSIAFSLYQYLNFIVLYFLYFIYLMTSSPYWRLVPATRSSSRLSCPIVAAADGPSAIPSCPRRCNGRAQLSPVRPDPLSGVSPCSGWTCEALCQGKGGGGSSEVLTAAGLFARRSATTNGGGARYDSSRAPADKDRGRDYRDRDRDRARDRDRCMPRP